jgi:GTP diphosphokinase / guanosine-3',5'-bis(diphosphate) 3'-diphosphatase
LSNNTMEKEQNDFLEKINSISQNDRERILKTIAWAEKESIDAKTGTASILMDLNLDADTVIAALLTEAGVKAVGAKDQEEKLSSLFSGQTAMLIMNYAKISRLSATNKTILEAENIRNMLLALTDDIRVILITLAEKLYSLRTPDLVPPEKRKNFAQECLDIYAPLANRLGISKIKDELEDLSLKFLNREVYQQIKDIVSVKRAERLKFLSQAREALITEAEKSGIQISVSSRPKHFYSIYMKMRKRNKSAEEIFDLFGMRIICETIEQCYTLLGIVHSLWKPGAGRFRDYIANPKSNGYQSLHTTVIVDEWLLEIQIRTKEMHSLAENGIASHWLYKKGSTHEQIQLSDVNTVNKLRNWRHGNNEQSAASSWLKEIKQEIFKNTIYVFTPQGKVIALPTGGTPIDFAYCVHSAIGDHCMGAKANGAIIPLSRELQNTEVIEILTNNTAHPHLSWLSIAKTHKARNKIRGWLKRNDDSIAAEKNIAAKKKPVTPEILPTPTAGTLQLQQVINAVPSDILSVKVEQEKNILLHFARCCNPVVGDPITGYVSRGRGIIIHRTDCPNIANIPDFTSRQIKADWENPKSALVKRFRIESKLHMNLFSEIEGAVRKHHGHLIEGRLEERSTNRLTGFFTMQLESPEDIKAVLKNIKGIPGLISLQQYN